MKVLLLYLISSTYIAFGGILLLTDIAIEKIPSNRIPIGLLLLAYGSFRLYTNYKSTTKE